MRNPLRRRGRRRERRRATPSPPTGPWRWKTRIVVGLVLSGINVVICIFGGIFSLLVQTRLKYSLVCADELVSKIVTYASNLVSFVASMSAIFSLIRFLAITKDLNWQTQIQMLIWDEFLHMFRICGEDLHGGALSPSHATSSEAITAEIAWREVWNGRDDVEDPAEDVMQQSLPSQRERQKMEEDTSDSCVLSTITSEDNDEISTWTDFEPLEMARQAFLSPSIDGMASQTRTKK